MLSLRIASRPLAIRVPRQTPALPPRTLHSRVPAPVQEYARRSRFTARIVEEGLPLQNSGPTTATLLVYAATHSVLPPGWSANWKQWD
ncbi:hypothetical protein K438DRAFT_1988383 [Mycena galopus ATCC 62051]|nr:hypothetical protein K438DRAFT_1988383 [Mycena galopus ATCC 62051]